jgi:hypothetical protein
LADVAQNTVMAAARTPASGPLIASTSDSSTPSGNEHRPAARRAAVLAPLIRFADEASLPLDHARAIL